MSIRYVNSKQEPLRSIGVLASSKSNSKVNSISHYKKSIELQYLM